jgi:hypothetical protein
MNFWMKITLALVAIWALAGGAIYWARHSKPTAQSMTAYIQNENIGSKSGAQRQRVISRVEDMLNRVSYDDRQQLQRSGATRNFLRSLTPEEQGAFLDATLPAGFKQMMESFNKMDPAKRKQFVERAVNDMKKHEGEQPPPNVNNQMTQRMIDQGLRSFYSDASADTKLDLAPLIEQMQKNMQSGSRL